MFISNNISSKYLHKKCPEFFEHVAFVTQTLIVNTVAQVRGKCTSCTYAKVNLHQVLKYIPFVFFCLQLSSLEKPDEHRHVQSLYKQQLQ